MRERANAICGKPSCLKQDTVETSLISHHRPVKRRGKLRVSFKDEVWLSCFSGGTTPGKLVIHRFFWNPHDEVGIINSMSLPISDGRYQLKIGNLKTKSSADWLDFKTLAPFWLHIQPRLTALVIKNAKIKRVWSSASASFVTVPQHCQTFSYWFVLC